MFGIPEISSDRSNQSGRSDQSDQLTRLTGLDTNILVRYITQDDPAQAALAERLIHSLTQQRPGFVTLVALAELCWVLNQSYKLSRTELLPVVDWLLDSTEILIEAPEQVIEARELFANLKADFGDCLISCCSRAAGCVSVFTFDKSAARAAEMTLLQ